jgi:hypothetical protein
MSDLFLRDIKDDFESYIVKDEVRPRSPEVICKQLNLLYKMPGLNLSTAAIQAIAYKNNSEST